MILDILRLKLLDVGAFFRGHMIDDIHLADQSLGL
jgi:hypothetical protein